MMNTQALLLTALVAFCASPALADTATPMPTKQTMAMLHDRNCATKTVQKYELDGSVIDAVRGPVVRPVTEALTKCTFAPVSGMSHMSHMSMMSNAADSKPTVAEPK
jgi:hypothetical protein